MEAGWVAASFDVMAAVAAVQKDLDEFSRKEQSAPTRRT